MRGQVNTNSTTASVRDEPDTYLGSSAIVDANHPNVTEFAKSRSTGHKDPRAKAVALYYAVRDELRYDPYTINYNSRRSVRE